MKIRYTAIAAVLLVLLSGCASAPETVGSEAVVSGESVAGEAVEVAPTTEPEPTPTVEPAPIQYTPEPTPEPDTSTGEAAYIAAAQDYLNGWGYWDFTDDQVLAAGLFACESTEVAVTIIEGVDPIINDEVVTYARTTLCP